MRSLLILLLTLELGCSEKGPNTKSQSETTLKPQLNSIPPTNVDSAKREPAAFSYVLSFPTISDTAAFIDALKALGNFGECWHPEREGRKERISYYKKVKLYGSQSEYLLVEYDYGSGAMACSPYKYQFLFTTQGNLIATLDALRFDFLKVFPNQNPFLLTVTSSSRGNGWHQLYKMSADTLENTYEGYTDYQVQTYDAGENETVYEPNELSLTIRDVNKDGYNDLVFSGKLILIQGLTKDSMWYDLEVRGKDTFAYSVDHPFKKLPIQYVFLYNASTGHFTESKKYSKGNPFIK